MKIIVTGGAGFIGSALSAYLSASGQDEVVVVDSFTYAANPLSLAPLEGRRGFRVIRQDICDFAAVDALVTGEKPDAILHLAAESHVDRAITGSKPFIETNVLGTYALLEAARRHWSSLKDVAAASFRFVQVSTDEVYGSLGPSGAFNETTRYDPSSPYSASKAAADHLTTAWHHTYGLPTIVTNCSNNYGPRQFPEKLIPLTILNALEGHELPLYGDGRNVRDWLHVEDHVSALNLVLRCGTPGVSYAIGARCEMTNIDIVHRICDLIDQRAPTPRRRCELIRFVTDRLGHDRRYAIDPTRIESELGWRPRWSFDDGLAATVDWYLDNQAWWSRLRASAQALQTNSARQIS